MTSYAHRRCVHCGTVYYCLRSGWGFPEYGDHSNPDYCLDCYQVILKALEAVPKKFEHRTMNVQELEQFSDVSWEQVVKWEEEYETSPEKKALEGKVIARRVFAPLFDLTDPDNRFSAREVAARNGPHTGVKFILETWTKTSDKNGVRIEVEWDLENDKLVGPWKWFR